MIRVVGPLLDMVGDWRALLVMPEEQEVELLQRHERSGRPLGQESFVETLEASLSRFLRRQKPGPKKRQRE